MFIQFTTNTEYYILLFVYTFSLDYELKLSILFLYFYIFRKNCKKYKTSSIFKNNNSRDTIFLLNLFLVSMTTNLFVS